MDIVFKKVYVLLHTNADGSTTDMGEANDHQTLQALYDDLNDALVMSIIEGVVKGNLITHVPKTKLRMRYCSKNGVYLQNIATEPVSNLVNNHDDFFRYYQEYKRSLYNDRSINKEMADTLLMVLKESPKVLSQIRSDEQNWFSEQMAISKKNGTPMIVHSYPRFKSHELQGELETRMKAALQVLSAADKKN